MCYSSPGTKAVNQEKMEMSLKYESIIKQMTLEEKAAMMSGRDTWSTVSYEKYGIPSMTMSDGPHGLRRQTGTGDHLGLNASLPATCFPTAATIANSWDEALGEKIGIALAEEAITMGVNVILGPGLNIKRNPLCGRNFEYFSEDPYHAGKMAAAYIKGIQSQGIAACPKHFAANSQELRRMANNSVVDERTFREIYTTGFEIAVKEGKAKSIMSAYNEINGIYANENKHLLQEILVDEWGFDGFVVSDWGGSNDHALGVMNGSHLEMPSTGKAGGIELIKAVKKGKLQEEVLDKRLDELLDVIFLTNTAADKGTGKKYDVEEHHALARAAAEESIVLLKNEDQILPLAENTKVTIIGDFAENPRYQGAGSSLVNPVKTPESIIEVIQDYKLKMAAYEQGYIRNKKTNDKLVANAVSAAKNAEVVLIFAGLDENSESEGLDRNHMKMPQAQNELIKAVTEVNKNVIVILSAGSVVEMPWIDGVKGVLHGYLGGQAGASAMINVIIGRHCPSGKLSETYLYKYEDVPSYRYYPGKERNSEFREGIYVGYRYYTTMRVPVRFPFGFGLSYTQFEYSDLQVEKEGIMVSVKNCGNFDGSEIVQLYVGRESESVFRPAKELKGFVKTVLKKGEEKRVKIRFDDKTFRYFDTRKNTWEAESGTYKISVGANVDDIRLDSKIEIEGTVKEGKYSKKELPNYFSGNITNVSDDEYRTMYEKEIPDGSWSGEIRINDAVCQLYYGKGILGKIFCGVLIILKKYYDWRGKPNLNILFIYNMPIRGFAKMLGGMVTMEMAEGLTELANGHRIKGTAHLFKAWFQKNKI